eukprot:TRINITY_DN1221_c0_g3_i1.p1 TRINITY_DN1221_c0_g3~~TRINITY_DN1221_c0_g3_i1.p1  ORF type:complete len:333 (+),score=94.90 TRINITY_DN1221_c0_g3_i1:59-1057(+)
MRMFLALVGCAAVIGLDAADTTQSAEVPEEAPEDVSTSAPPTEAPPTMAPATDAPATPAPATNSPPTMAPTPMPTLSPLIQWCAVNMDCATFGDKAATCVDGKCACGAGYRNPVHKDTGATAYACTTTNKKMRAVAHATFDALCEKLTDDLVELLSTALGKIYGGKVTSIKKMCGSLVVIANIEEAPVDYVMTTDLLSALTHELNTDTAFAALVAAVGLPQSAGISVLDILQCSSTPIDDATIVVKMGTMCTAYECRAGFEVENGICIEDSSNEMSAGVIVAIVIGCAVAILAIGGGIFYLTKQKRAGKELENPSGEDGWARRPRTTPNTDA